MNGASRSEGCASLTVSWRALGAASLAALCGVAAPACAEDRILPVDEVCGDGFVVGTEECDNASGGCLDCRVATGWRCPGNRCAEICGDGLVTGAETCDPPNGITCDTHCRMAVKDEACDMTGYWLARETNFSRDTVIEKIQTSTNWYLFEFAQAGTAFVVEKQLFCGVHVVGSVTVDLTDKAYRGLMYQNSGTGTTKLGRRLGSFEPKGDTCAFSLERWYILRGLDDRYLPADFRKHPALTELLPLPVEPDPLSPSGEPLPGVEDWDEDGKPGIAWNVRGIVSGRRHSVQRDWVEYGGDGQAIPAHAVEFRANVRFDGQESLLAVDQCGESCGMMRGGSVPASDAQSYVTFRYLGRALTDARVAEVVTREPMLDADADMETCAKVKAAMPHEGGGK